MILQILITLSKKYSNINNFYVILKINNTDAQPYHFYFCYSAATIIKFSTEMVITAIIKYHYYYSSFDYQNCYLSYGHCKFTTRTINAIIMISLLFYTFHFNTITTDLLVEPCYSLILPLFAVINLNSIIR